MIAPVRRTPPRIRFASRTLAQARRAIAVALLADRFPKRSTEREIPAWQLWLFAAWTALVAGSLLWCLGAWWRVAPY